MDSNNGNSTSNPTLVVNASPFIPEAPPSSDALQVLQEVADISQNLAYVKQRIYKDWSQRKYEKEAFCLSGKLLPALKNLLAILEPKSNTNGSNGSADVETEEPIAMAPASCSDFEEANEKKED